MKKDEEQSTIKFETRIANCCASSTECSDHVFRRKKKFFLHVSVFFYACNDTNIRTRIKLIN